MRTGAGAVLAERVSALDFRRLRWTDVDSTPALLGGRLVGLVDDPGPARAGAPLFGLELLAQGSLASAPVGGGPLGDAHPGSEPGAPEDPERRAVPILDAWFGDRMAVAGRHGCVQFASDGQWLHGVAEVDDAVHPGGLQAAARDVYADIFELLATNPCRHLLRVWNYIADINGHDERAAGSDVGACPTGAPDAERYRRFNSGRQQAFLDAGRQAFEGAPAACALGMRAGPLRVHILAGRVASVAIENPRQVSAYRYPAIHGPASPSFSRAALAPAGGGRIALFVSGTASILGHESVHRGDVRRQTEETLANIAALREAAAVVAGVEFPADSLVYTVYLRRAGDLQSVRPTFDAAVGAASRDALWIEADVCRAELLIEIEAHAIVDAGAAA